MSCMEMDLKHLTSQKLALYRPAKGMMFFFRVIYRILTGFQGFYGFEMVAEVRKALQLHITFLILRHLSHASATTSQSNTTRKKQDSSFVPKSTCSTNSSF